MARTFVYFITYEDGPIKIGQAKNVKARMATLQTGIPFKLFVLGVLYGSGKMERSLHERFKHLRLQGEWFSRAPELLDYISERSVDLYENSTPDAKDRQIESLRSQLKEREEQFSIKIRQKLLAESEDLVVGHLKDAILSISDTLKSHFAYFDRNLTQEVNGGTVSWLFAKKLNDEIRSTFKAIFNCDWRQAERIMAGCDGEDYLADLAAWEIFRSRYRADLKTSYEYRKYR